MLTYHQVIEVNHTSEETSVKKNIKIGDMQILVSVVRKLRYVVLETQQ